jgi:hypothetical protein
LIRALSIVLLSSGASGCLDFTCKACIDAGMDASCGVANLWGTVSPLASTTCTALDAGLDGTGGSGSASCGWSLGFAPTTWGVAMEAPSPGAGTWVCAHVRMTALSLEGREISLNLHCQGCPMDAGCDCAEEGAPCMTGATGGLDEVISGPFRVPSASCSNVEVSLAVMMPDAGEFAFDEAWAWQTTLDAGCVWSENQCPGP